MTRRGRQEIEKSGNFWRGEHFHRGEDYICVNINDISH